MKDYYNSFINLSLLQCTKNDYGNTRKIKTHNEATKKLNQLQNEMKQTDCEDVLFMLLSHEDERVKINAASLCFQINILVDQAVLVLKKIIKTSTDSTMRFSAEMILGNKAKER